MKSFTNPVVYAVDMNNFGKSMAPKTLSGIASKTLQDPKFYFKQVLSRLNPFSLVTSLTTLTYGNYRKMGDPTVKHIPLLLPNYAHQLFREIEKFEFNDESQFDFSGARDFSSSNERDKRTYAKSYEYKSFLGQKRVKLDWIFVKPQKRVNPDYGASYYYLPSEPVTIYSPNKPENKAISRHYPLSIKLNI